MHYNITEMKEILNIANERSLVVDIRTTFVDFRFTEKQRVVCETFLFGPTKNNAIQALVCTPKSWILVKNYLKRDREMEQQVISHISNLIETGKLKGWYMRSLAVNGYLKGYQAKLLAFGQSNKLERYIKQFEMESKLKK
ncbi:hypothetical protein LLY41_02640 [Cytobacillus firmus]|uniref:hypothetical protein n=1 Tax=Cytobacillus firmus TaxID=1399 RepID=UPI00218AFC8E|nr:hypothetical protein [Cytobacillus firmus]URM33399.1 hypothetical protein LLY41_02640 [Cytobacillus firmus]